MEERLEVVQLVNLAMKKAVALVLAFSFAGISFSQQTDFPKPEFPNRYIVWCKQNWEQCKEMRLRRLSVEKECLERSQSYDAFRECMFLRKEKIRDEK
jgi:hypothetical protein